MKICVATGIILAVSTCGALAADSIQQTNQLGPVKAITTLVPKQPMIGDEIHLEIRVQSPPDVEVLMPEFGEALDRYTILDFVPKQTIESDGTIVSIQRYTLQPYLSGDQFIPPILIEFVDHRPGHKPAPKDADAFELLTDRIDFTVKSVLPTDTKHELNPPLGELALPPSGARRYGWLIGTGCLLAVLAVAVGAVYLRSHRRKVRRRSAYEIARTRLDRLLAQPRQQTAAAIESFFVQISAIIRRYLEDRFDLHAPELTTEEFLAIARSSKDLTRVHQELLRDFLQQADLIKFAGVNATHGDIQRSAELAIQFLEDTRENAPLVEREEPEDDKRGE